MTSYRDKIILLFAIIGYFYSTADAESFEFGDGSGPCILANLDAVFNLSRTYDFNQTEIADIFTLEGANVTSSQSKCGTDTFEALLTLNLFPSSEYLKIKFVKEVGNDNVLMSVVLNVSPGKHFNDSTSLPFEMEDDGDLPIGQRNNSFTCGSQLMMSFGQDPGYFMTMKITNMQIQGYDVEGGVFSPAVECAQDNFTTTAQPEPTTEPFTTPVTIEPMNGTTEETPATLEPGNVTTEATPITLEPITTEMTPVTLEPETTTLPPEPSVPKFDVGDGAVKCIVLQGEMMFRITYMTTAGEDRSIPFPIPANAQASGNCSLDADTQEIVLTFFEDWKFTVKIAKLPTTLLQGRPMFRSLLADGVQYSWKEMQLDYVVSEQRFPNPAETGPKSVSKPEESGIFQGSSQGSYKCTAGESVDLDENVKLDVSKLQYRAFGETDDDAFPSDDVSECAADHDNDDDDDSNTTAIVLGSVFGGLAFILLVVVIVIAIRKRQNRDYEVM